MRTGKGLQARALLESLVAPLRRRRLAGSPNGCGARAIDHRHKSTMIHRRFVTSLSLFALLFFTGSIAFGQATKVVIETADDGSGSPVGDATLTAGQTITVYAIARDDADTFIENVQVDVDGWSLINTTGGVVGGDLNPAGNRRSATFTAQKIGSAQINATVAGLVSIPSGVQTVIAGAPVRVAVETQANGGGTVVPTQSLASGSSVNGFAITRDAFDNFVANEAATWSLQSITGGVSPSDLTASGDSKSAQFTGVLVGTAQVQADVSGLTSGLSGTITVTPGPAAQLAFVQQPTDEASSTAIAPAVTVHVLDAAGNLRTTSTRNVTISLGANPGGGTLSGTLSVAAVGGIATFSNLLIDKARQRVHACCEFADADAAHAGNIEPVQYYARRSGAACLRPAAERCRFRHPDFTRGYRPSP